MIAFKNTRALDDWHEAHPMLREAVLFLLATLPSDRDLICTRIAEPDPLQATAIHTCGPPHRAADFRVWNWPEQTMARAVVKLNAEFTYDGDRPKSVAMIHDAGSGSHLHVQVSNNTVRRQA